MTDSEKFDIILSEIRLMRGDIGSIEKKVESMDSRLGSIEKKVESMDSRLGSVEKKVESMDSRLGSVEKKVESMEDRIEAIEEINQVLVEGVTRVELKLENETNHNIQLIAENHITLIDKLNQAIKVSDKTLMFEVQLSGMKFRLDNLEKEVAELKLIKV